MLFRSRNRLVGVGKIVATQVETRIHQADSGPVQPAPRTKAARINVVRHNTLQIKFDGWLTTGRKVWRLRQLAVAAIAERPAFRLATGAEIKRAGLRWQTPTEIFAR